MTSVLSLILHYQKYIEKCPNDEKRVLRCIDKLHQLGVTVHHLQETGVGRTINALRKEQGDVGKAARALVTKWKLMVAAEEDSSDPEDARQAPESPQDSGRESDDNHEQHVDQVKEEQCYSYDKKPANERHDDHHSRKRPSEHDRPSDQNKRSKREHSSTERSDYEERKQNSYANHSENDNYDDIENSDQANYEQQSNYKVETNISSNLEDKHNADHLNRHKSHKYLEEAREHSSQKSKHHTKDNTDEQTVPQSTSGSHHKSSRSDKHKESESKRHLSESTKHHHSKERNAEKREERDKSTSANDSAKHSSNDKHRQSKDKEKEKSSSKSRSKESSTEKHKKYSHDKEKSRDDSASVSREKVKQEKNKHSQSSESNSKHHSNDAGSHSGKEYSSKSRHESKKQSSHEGNGSSSRHKEKSNDKSSSKNRESKSSKSSSSNDCDVRTVSSKELSEKPKKERKVKILTPASEDSEDGIDCESGASFAEALGMVSPSKSKKKSSSQKDSAKSSPVADMSKNTKTKSSASNAHSANSSSTLSNEVQIASLLAPTTKLAPLPAIEISALPEISTNYKPRPPPKLMASLNSEEEALRSVMSNKNQRTKVYSGNKIYGILPSLYDLCVFVLQEHIDALEYTGGVPYEILKPVVDRATPEQLFTLEHYNPYLMEDTNHLWQKHCEKRFRTKKRLEMETWREMYMRCQDEQDEKLRSLTANIKMSQEVKNAPTRQTKMAYVDSVVKPPRGIARKQAIHGTARAPVVSPAARVAALATGNVVKPESARPQPMSSGPPMRSSSSFVKPKKAPLMQKALQFMKGRIKR